MGRWPVGVLPSAPASAQRVHTFRAAAFLLLVLGCALVSLSSVTSGSRVPSIWPAAAVTVGLMLGAPPRRRVWLLAVAGVLVLSAHLLRGYPVAVAVGFSLSGLASAWVVRVSLVRGLGDRPAALLDDGDVSRLIGAIASGSLVAGGGYGLTDLVTGTGNPWLGLLAAFGSYAAAQIVLLPLFLETPRFEALAGGRERIVQFLLTVGTTVVVFRAADTPPVMFAVMPMFAWYALRGTLREATVLLTIVGAIGTAMTWLEIGPVWGLRVRYGLAPELANGVLQLFLLDCGLILLPLSVLATQQRKATARADSGRETLERLVAAATGTAVIAIDRTGRITLFNPGAEALFGCAADEVLGELLERHLAGRDLARHAADLGVPATFSEVCRASSETADTTRLWTVRRRDGEERVIRMTLNAVPGERGELSGYLAIGEDVTERESAHRALLLALEHERTAVERLRELERVKGDFVSTVSHELRTPITSIIGYTEMLDEGFAGDLTPDQHGLVERVDRNSRRLLLLVEDLLTLSQIESSSLKIRPVVTDLRTVVTRAYESLAPGGSHDRLTVDVRLPDHPVVHEGDPVQLERMVLNLLTNAVKFTPDVGSVVVSLEPEGDDTLIVVADTGIGIAPEEQSRLFNRFFRSSAATQRAIQGTGLGLTIVNAIVALHRGDIEVRSTPGVGTRIAVRLPRLRAVATAHAVEQLPLSDPGGRAGAVGGR